MPDHIDLRLNELEEQERLETEQKKLRSYQLEIKKVFNKNIDNLHMNFLDKFSRKYGEVTFEEAKALREFAEYLKEFAKNI